MTTATLSPLPKRKRGRPAKRKRTMTEQSLPVITTDKVVLPKESTPITITKVQSHLSDVQLISRDALWNDFQNRIKINNYEVSKAMEDLKSVVKATHELASPYVDKAVAKVKELRS